MGIKGMNVTQESSQVIALRKATNNADWAQYFAEKKTQTLCSAAWAASEARCEQLRTLCQSTGAKRVLEIGSFVGVSTLSMAQVLPENGSIVSLESDPFAVDFGLDIKVESDAFWKINHMVGPAWESLQSLVQQMEDAHAEWEPFDLAVVDADKAGMMEYLEMLTQVPGLMSDNYVICVDFMRVKGQLSTRKQDTNDSFLVSSAQSQIDALREYVEASSEFECHEDGSLLQVCKKQSFTMANSPFAAFPNCYTCGRDANWAAPQAMEMMWLVSGH